MFSVSSFERLDGASTTSPWSATSCCRCITTPTISASSAWSRSPASATSRSSRGRSSARAAAACSLAWLRCRSRWRTWTKTLGRPGSAGGGTTGASGSVENESRTPTASGSEARAAGMLRFSARSGLEAAADRGVPLTIVFAELLRWLGRSGDGRGAGGAGA
ncbi:MAG: DUF1559 domain-containing protein, partial [Polyangiaceae bacterium]|nr:DUF1559 domain-containing protein [Polyangiaceae bacterium]